MGGSGHGHLPTALRPGRATPAAAPAMTRASLRRPGRSRRANAHYVSLSLAPRLRNIPYNADYERCCTHVGSARITGQSARRRARRIAGPDNLTAAEEHVSAQAAMRRGAACLQAADQFIGIPERAYGVYVESLHSPAFDHVR
jgi:hypothetical protein